MLNHGNSGRALSVASTVVLLRALEAQGALDSVDGRIAVGWLIVEDLVMVLALVLLPALAEALGGAAPGHDPGTAGAGVLGPPQFSSRLASVSRRSPS